MRLSKQRLVNQLFFGGVALTCGVGVGFLLFREWKPALLAGLTTLPASYSGALVVEFRRLEQDQRLRGSLRSQIQSLLEQRQQLYTTLSEAYRTQQELQGSIQALHQERSQLLSRVSELHQHRSELYQEFEVLQHQKRQFAAKQPPKQLQAAASEDQDLNNKLFSKTIQIQQAEIRFKQLKGETDNLQNKIAQQKQEQERLQQQIKQLFLDKEQLEVQKQSLTLANNHLQENHAEIKEGVAQLETQRYETESQIYQKQLELEQLETQRQQLQDKIAQEQEELLNKKAEKSQDNSDNLTNSADPKPPDNQPLPPPSQHPLDAAKTPSNSLEKPEILENLPLTSTQSDKIEEIPSEWLELIQELTVPETEALQAILTQNETQLKTIADTLATMPEVLIETLNEKALNTLGDTVFASQSSTVIPEIHEEYQDLIPPLTQHCQVILQETNPPPKN